MSHSGEHQELQHASDMSGESCTSAIRVDVSQNNEETKTSSGRGARGNPLSESPY